MCRVRLHLRIGSVPFLGLASGTSLRVPEVVEDLAKGLDALFAGRPAGKHFVVQNRLAVQRPVENGHGFYGRSGESSPSPALGVRWFQSVCQRTHPTSLHSCRPSDGRSTARPRIASAGISHRAGQPVLRAIATGSSPNRGRGSMDADDRSGGRSWAWGRSEYCCYTQYMSAAAICRAGNDATCTERQPPARGIRNGSIACTHALSKRASDRLSCIAVTRSPRHCASTSERA